MLTGEIDQMLVQYILYPDSKVTGDTFKFKVTDKGKAF